MSQGDILLVSALAGLAMAITASDLLISLFRQRRAARVRAYSSRLELSPQDQAAAATRSEWIKRRLAAIQNASNEAPPPVEPAGSR